ncbi:MAG: DMT family transporter [Spirochaetaceae bacterium]|jgi:drug/metabolite transporter (DMT)-like permease|nr:DMT family transporter [Spirochaetaceae bacterium]
MKKINIAIPVIILATALGASSGLYIKSLPFSSMALTGFRMGVPFLLLLPMMIRRKMILGPVKNRKKIWIGSLLNTVRMVLYILSYKLTTLTNAVVLLYLWPIFALLIHAFLSKERIKLKEAGLLFMALSGVVFLNIHKGFSFSESDLTGSLVMILSAIIFSISIVIFKDALADNSEGEVLYFQNALGALIFVPILFMEIPGVPLPDILTGLFYGLSVGVLGFGFFFFALKRLPIFQYGALGYIEVFFGVLYGIVLLGEDLRWNIILGAVLILVSSFLSRLGSLKKSPGRQ